MFRRKASPRTDRRYFTRTAAHTKGINLSAKVFRGGIRM